MGLCSYYISGEPGSSERKRTIVRSSAMLGKTVDRQTKMIYSFKSTPSGFCITIYEQTTKRLKNHFLAIFRRQIALASLSLTLL